MRAALQAILAYVIWGSETMRSSNQLTSLRTFYVYNAPCAVAGINANRQCLFSSELEQSIEVMCQQPSGEICRWDKYASGVRCPKAQADSGLLNHFNSCCSFNPCMQTLTHRRWRGEGGKERTGGMGNSCDPLCRKFAAATVKYIFGIRSTADRSKVSGIWFHCVVWTSFQLHLLQFR